MKFKYRFPILWEANSGGSGGSSALEQALAAAQKQAQEAEKKLQKLQAQIDSGKLVDPDAWLKVKLDAGELYPKDRYVGLQQTLQQEKDAKKITDETLAALKTSSEELQAKFTSVEQAAQAAQQELQQTKTALRRTKVIVEKYPTLLPFEFPGEDKPSLLPVAPEDQLDNVLGVFAQKLGTMSDTAKKDFAAGGGGPTPPPTPPEKPTKPEDHLKLAHEALDKQDRKAYDTHYDNYLSALNQETAKT